jgi:hypothetical protein
MYPLVTINIAKFSERLPVWITPLFLSSNNTLNPLEGGNILDGAFIVANLYPISRVEVNEVSTLGYRPVEKTQKSLRTKVLAVFSRNISGSSPDCHHRARGWLFQVLTGRVQSERIK